jgi:hypothetical protein
MFKVIMWATDGSSGAAQALPFAKGLAQADGARLIVVHVKEIVSWPGRRTGQCQGGRGSGRDRETGRGPEAERSRREAPTGRRDGRRRGACDRGDRKRAGSRLASIGFAGGDYSSSRM